jgi:hypothetical protein
MTDNIDEIIKKLLIAYRNAVLGEVERANKKLDITPMKWILDPDTGEKYFLEKDVVQLLKNRDQVITTIKNCKVK